MKLLFILLFFVGSNGLAQGGGAAIPIRDTDPLYIKYQSKWGFIMQQVISSDSSKKKIYIIDYFNDDLILSDTDSPLMVKDSLKVIRALVETVRALFDEKIRQDAVRASCNCDPSLMLELTNPRVDTTKPVIIKFRYVK